MEDKKRAQLGVDYHICLLVGAVTWLLGLFWLCLLSLSNSFHTFSSFKHVTHSPYKVQPSLHTHTHFYTLVHRRVVWGYFVDPPSGAMMTPHLPTPGGQERSWEHDPLTRMNSATMTVMTMTCSSPQLLQTTVQLWKIHQCMSPHSVHAELAVHFCNYVTIIQSINTAS